MKKLLAEINDHFRMLESRLQCFSSNEVQVEAWFKGEMLFLLEQLKGKKFIKDFKAEVPAMGRKKIDIWINFQAGQNWVELKHWLIGTQKGNRWRAVDYVYDLENKFKKFDAVDAGSHGYVLVLCTENPGEEAWDMAIQKFNANCKPMRLVPCSSVFNYPKSYFLGLLQCLQKKAR